MESLPVIEETAATLTVRDDYQSAAVVAAGGVVTLFLAAGFAFFAFVSVGVGGGLLFALRQSGAVAWQIGSGCLTGAVSMGAVAWWLFRAGGGMVKRASGPDRAVAQVWHFDRTARALVVAERHFHAPTQSQRDIPTATYPLPPAGSVRVVTEESADTTAYALRIEAGSLRLSGVGHYTASLGAMTALADQINRFLAA